MAKNAHFIGYSVMPGQKWTSCRRVIGIYKMLATQQEWRAFIVCVCMGGLLQSFCQYTGTLQGDGDVAADIVLTDELVESGLGEYL